MFKDLSEGQTHYNNDGCGVPAHNPSPNNGEERLLGIDTGNEGGDKTVEVYGFVEYGKVNITRVKVADEPPKEPGKKIGLTPPGGFFDDVEPGRKPSEIIQEKVNRKMSIFHPMTDHWDWVYATIDYLDELHERGKI